MYGKQQGGQSNNPPQGLAKGLGDLVNQNKPNQGNSQPNKSTFKPPSNQNINPSGSNQNYPNPLNDLGGVLGRSLKPNQYNNDPSYNQCPRHNQMYVQYCTSDHEPMCEICIGEHLELHQKALKTTMNFIPINKALDDAKDKFALIRQKIVDEIRMLDKQDINSHLEDMVQRVIVSKKLMIGQVNKIAQSRLKDIEIIETNYRKVQFLKPFNEAGNIINNYIDDLHGPKRIQKIQHASLFDQAEFLATFQRTIKENNLQLEKSKCDIIYDKIQFSKMLQKCFYLSIPTYALTSQDDETPQQKGKKDIEKKIFQKFENNINKAAEEERDMKMQYMRQYIYKDENFNKQPVLSVEEQKKIEMQKQIKKQKQAELIPIDYGEPVVQKKPLNQGVKQKLTIIPENEFNYVHYFQTGSKRLHLYNLNEGILETRNLKCDPIPYYHKSVQTSDSTLFLSGGKHSTSRVSKRNQNLWIYSISKDLFRIATNNLKPRSSHTLVQHKRHLYIIGGFNETNFEREVERFDLPDAKSIFYCTPSYYAGECISASVGNHIWKVSMDGIEIYSAEEDKWGFVTIKDFKYFQSSICAAIGPDQIFVFGGYDESERGVKNTYVIRAVKPIPKIKDADGETFEIEKWNKYMLTDPEGFSDNTVAMNNNNIYCWINDSNDYNEVRTDKKTLITFDSYEWRYVPYQRNENG